MISEAGLEDTNKENTPYKPRVSFSLSVETDVPTREPLKPMNLNDIQLKPILKNRSETVVVLSDLDSGSEEEEIEDPNALQCATYFQGPINTLAASLNSQNSGSISHHDLAEAYNLLSSRIRANGEAFVDPTYTSPAIETLFKSKAIFAETLKRDISCALKSPFDSDNSESQVGRGMTEDEVKLARDQTSVCHGAMRFVSDIFRLKTLQKPFLVSELTSLLKCVLELGLEKTLPSYNAKKTFGHVVWLLQTHRLLPEVFAPLTHEITRVIERAISGEMGKIEKGVPLVDGLIAARHQISLYHDIFIPIFTKNGVLLTVLTFMTCKNQDLRKSATQILLLLANFVSRDKISPKTRKKVSATVRRFIGKADYRDKKVRPVQQALKDALVINKQEPALLIFNAYCVLGVVASLIVLTGPSIFAHPKSLKLLLNAIGGAKTFVAREVQILRMCAWRCLVWSFLQLDAKELGNIEIEEEAHKVIIQELGEDVSVAIMGSILARDKGVTPQHAVNWTLSIMTQLIGSTLMNRLGINVLHRLLEGISGTALSCSWHNNYLLPYEILSGSLSDLGIKFVRKAIMDIPSLEIKIVRPLRRHEVVSNWDAILKLWQSAVEKELFLGNNIMEEKLKEMIKYFLSFQVEAIQGNEQHPAPEEIANALSSVISSFFELHQRQFSRATEKQCLQTVTWALHIIHTVWGVIPDSHLSDIASSTLERLLGLKFKVEVLDVQVEWDRLVQLLLFLGRSKALQITFDINKSNDYPEDTNKRLWQIMLRALEQDNGILKADLSWEALVTLLNAPIGHWELEHDEFKWRDLLVEAISQAGQQNAPAINVLDSVCSNLMEHSNHRDASRLLSHLIWKLPSVTEGASCAQFLSKISDYLSSCYPPESSVDAHFSFISEMRAYIRTKPDLEALKVLQKGLIPWIEDKLSRIGDVDYNEHIIPAYCDFLEAIRHLSPVEDSITEFTGILTSVFNKEPIPHPANGVLAFKGFWEMVSPGLEFTNGTCPGNMRLCVQALSDAFGGDIPDWMQSGSLATSSKSPVAQTITLSNCGDPPALRLPGSIMESANANSLPEADSAEIAVLIDNKQAQQDEILRESESRGEAHHEKPNVEPTGHQPMVNEETSERLSLDVVEATPSPSLAQSKNSELASSPHIVEQIDDYSVWEVRISSQEVRELNMQEDNIPSLTEVIQQTSSPDAEAFRPEDQQDADGDITLSVGDEPQKNTGQRIERSRTAPAKFEALTSGGNHDTGIGDSTSDTTKATPLSRAHTTSSVPLDTLERLHSTVSSGTFHMETQDLAQAAHMIHEIAGIVNEQMTKKLSNKKQ